MKQVSIGFGGRSIVAAILTLIVIITGDHRHRQGQNLADLVIAQPHPPAAGDGCGRRIFGTLAGVVVVVAAGKPHRVV